MRKLSYLTIILAITLFSCRKNNVINTGLNNGLVAYYPLDGNARDYTKYSNHGEITATKVSDRFGNQTKAYEFSKNFFQSKNIPVDISKQYTFSFWIQMKKYEDGMAVMELAKNKECDYNPQIWQYNNGLYLTTASNINNSIHVFSLAGIKFGTELPRWYHVLWTVSGDTTNLYLNGMLKETKLMPWMKRAVNNPQAFGVDLTLGNSGNACPGEGNVSNYHNQPSNVLVDEVRVYNRILSFTEIQLLAK